MFTSPTASRDFALKACDAAERAMKRHECCKSQFKFKCFSCGEFINRGDKITKCTAPCWDGMRLRFRGADARNGLTMEETAFYLAETGTRTWVHIGCNPCYWDSLPEDSNEYSPPALRSAYTGWGAKVSYEFDEWRQRTNHYDMEEFLEKHGYPQEKWMKDRINNVVTRFQAIWRGHLYKKAYPLALAQRRAKELTIWREFLAWCGSLPPQQFRSFPLFCKLKGIHTVYSGIQLGRYAATAAVDKEEEDAPASTSHALADADVRSRNGFLYQNSIGAHVEVVFDEKRTRAAIYSAEVIKIQGVPEIDGLYYWVKFHHDGEVRKYHWKRLRDLILESKTFKSKHGILAEIKGKISIYCFIHGASYTTKIYKKQKIKKK